MLQLQTRADRVFPSGERRARQQKQAPLPSNGAKPLTRCGSHISAASPRATNICVCTFPFDLGSAVRDDNGVNIF